MGQTNLAVHGASALYRGIGRDPRIISLDKLLLKTHPNYQTSSNRLHLALCSLSSDPADSYFTNVTNALLNANEPLLWVDGL